jgi:hypothetical protein
VADRRHVRRLGRAGDVADEGEPSARLHGGQGLAAVPLTAEVGLVLRNQDPIVVGEVAALPDLVE